MRSLKRCFCRAPLSVFAAGWGSSTSSQVPPTDTGATSKPAKEQPKRRYVTAKPSRDGYSEVPFEYPTYRPNRELEQLKGAGITKYGSDGTYSLYRALYKELCDEMRHEFHSKPPGPSIEGFTLEHQPGSGIAIFRRPAIPNHPKGTSPGKVFVYTELRLKDPNRINELATFINWFSAEVCVFRDGIVMQASIGLAEGQLVLRNVKVYPDLKEETLQYTDEANFVRNLLKYDGPYMGHLEQDFQSELHDTLFDHGINPDSMRWFCEWSWFLEHIEHTRWAWKILQTLIPKPEKEEDFLTREERQELDSAADEWLPARDM